MAEPQIRFNDGAADERTMGVSRALYPADAAGRVVDTGWANAVKGMVPA